MAKTDELFHRERHLRNTFTQAEIQVFSLTTLTSLVAFCLAKPRSYGLLGFFLIASGITPYILGTHEITHPFFINALWKRAFLLYALVWVLLAQFSIGLLQNPIEIFVIGEDQFATPAETHAFLPTTTRPLQIWMAVFGLCAVYLTLIILFIVPKSRYFFERTMTWLCSLAVSIAIFSHLLPFYGSNFLLGNQYQRVSSDIFQFIRIYAIG